MKNKKFDSVKMMRDIREKLSKELSIFSTEEKIALLKEELPQDWKKHRPTSKVHNK